MMIELKHIEKRFGDLTVLKNVSLSIAEGSVMALVGPSGGGKSTLLRCMNLLEIPTSGSVEIDGDRLDFQPGVKVTTKSIQLVRRHSGMVFQNFQLFPHRTVIENVTEGLTTVLKWPKEKARERAMALLDKVGLAHKAEVWPSTLSGGQQQRVAIARAIALEPRVMLFDEPTSALDPELVGGVLQAMRELREDGMTMVVVSHEMGFARAAADRVVFMADGMKLEEGPPAQIFGAPQHERTQNFIRQIERH